MGKVTGTLGGNGGFVSATGVIVLTLFTLALLFNAVMPALGMAKSSALCTLLLATLGLVGLVRSRPVFAVSMLYVLAIGMTAFLAGVGLEDGGYLTETDVIGDATGAFSRLLSFYLILSSVRSLPSVDFSTSARSERRSRRGSPCNRSASRWDSTAATIIAIGVIAGLTSGFSLFSGINRYALRNDSSNGMMFNLFLNNQSFMGFCWAPSPPAPTSASGWRRS